MLFYMKKVQLKKTLTKKNLKNNLKFFRWWRRQRFCKHYCSKENKRPRSHRLHHNFRYIFSARKTKNYHRQHAGKKKCKKESESADFSYNQQTKHREQSGVAAEGKKNRLPRFHRGVDV